MSLNWGIASTGEIAKNMAQAFTLAQKPGVVAVSSRSEERAEAFAHRHGIPRSYASLEGMLEDEGVDIIYVAGPHTVHYEHSLMALEAGKHVLCEKPLTINAAETAELVHVSQARGRFLMEAMWMRFFPAMDALRKMIQRGELGAIRLVSADFCIKPPYDPSLRLFNRELGGGALLDLGVYPLSLGQMVLGAFDEVGGSCLIGETGVDICASMSLRSKTGGIASLVCGLNAWKPREAHIVGEIAEVFIPEIFFRPDRLIVRRQGETDRELHFPFDGNGYIHEVRHFEACIEQGLSESPIMPLRDSLEIVKITDRLRAQWGVWYPQEVKKNEQQN